VSFTPSRILVTGGAGFIGSNYLLHCVPSYPAAQFVNLDLLTYAGNLANLRQIESLENYHFERGDVADPVFIRSLFERWQFDTVVHFAAESHVDRSILDPGEFVRTNVTGTLTLLQAAKEAWKDRFDECRFHHISTDEVFGSLGLEGEFREDTAYAPSSPYAASKAAADHLVRSFGTTYGFPYVMTNTSNNYGPFQFPEKLIPLVIRNASERKEIPVYGKGENIRDWLYVTDHCEALDLVLRQAATEDTFLIGGSQEVTNLDLVHLLLDVYDRQTSNEPGRSRELIRFVGDRPGHDFRYALDSSPIQNRLGWTPKHDLTSGLEATVAWYLDNQEWMDAIFGKDYLAYYEVQYGNR